MVEEGNRQSNVAEDAGEKPAGARPIDIPDVISVKQLSDALNISAIDVVKHLMRNGIMANVNQAIDYESAAAVVTELGFQPRRVRQVARKAPSEAQEIKKQRLQQGVASGLKPRPPVVTVMGHVNHGKTRLLDAIRKTNVMESEAGGITQHIGAYQVEIDGKKITFLDTPGHEAFTAMRAHGAQVTDIAILVVAADDGVMPQTIEAIEHAKAAAVPIVVAANKIDRPEANLERVKQQLADAKLLVEEWGGNAIMVPVSARENLGIPDLLENLLLVAEMEELQANPAKPAEGVVIEAEMDRTKGPLATILVQDGTLRVGDTVVVGDTWGKLKAMYNDAGKQVRRAEPSTPVEILGLNDVPREGAVLRAVADERRAKAVLEKRKAERQAASALPKAVSLGNLFEQVRSGRIKELNIILKTDVQGSIEPIRSSLEQLSLDEVKVRIIRSASGNITENDVMLAAASHGLIIGFNADTEPGARQLADLEGVSIRRYDVIYNLIDDVSKALKGMLEPTQVEVIEGRAEVRAVFPAAKKQKIAGVYITEGRARRGVSARVRRNDEVIAESVLSSLRRFKDDVTEVAAGYECGIGLENFNDFEIGDTFDFFRIDTVH